MVEKYLSQQGRITRQEVIDLCRLTPDQAYKLLKQLCKENSIKKSGDRKSAYYIKA